MSSSIILNVKTPIKLRDVYVIDRVTPQDVERLAIKTGLPQQRLEVFQSNLRFIGGANLLATQSFEQIAAKVKGRFLTVRSEPGEDGQAVATQIVPIDAVRHIELVSDEDRQAMKARYSKTDPAKIDALKTRIVYFEVDPSGIENGRVNFFHKMFPIDIKADLQDAQNHPLVEITNGRFVLADEIVDARDLTEAELRSLARKYNVRSDRNGDLTTSITLRSGDLIMSSYSAEDLAGRLERSLAPPPQAAKPQARRAAIR